MLLRRKSGRFWCFFRRGMDRLPTTSGQVPGRLLWLRSSFGLLLQVAFLDANFGKVFATKSSRNWEFPTSTSTSTSTTTATTTTTTTPAAAAAAAAATATTTAKTTATAATTATATTATATTTTATTTTSTATTSTSTGTTAIVMTETATVEQPRRCGFAFCLRLFSVYVGLDCGKTIFNSNLHDVGWPCWATFIYKRLIRSGDILNTTVTTDFFIKKWIWTSHRCGDQRPSTFGDAPWGMALKGKLKIVPQSLPMLALANG